MLPLDADALYDLPEASRRLFVDPWRLRRLARRRQAPSVVGQGRLGFPRAWVDAASGAVAADAEGLRTYWLARLAPARAEARRPARDAKGLEAQELLTPGEAARRLCADPLALERLVAEGALPPLRVDGETRFDATLVDRVAREDEGEAEAAAADQRRQEVAAWSRWEYVHGLDQGAATPPTPARPAPPAAVAAAPGAWRLPEDLIAPTSPADASAEPTSSDPVIEAPGYETRDDEDP